MRITSSIALVACGLASMVAAASAQDVIGTEMSGRALVYLGKRQIEGCGIRLVVAEAPPPPVAESRIAIHVVTFSIYRSGNAFVSGGSVAGVSPARTSHAARPLRGVAPSIPLIQARGAAATRPMSAIRRGSEAGFVEYEPALGSVGALFHAFERGEPILVAMTGAGAGSGRLYSGRIEMDEVDSARVDNCTRELVR